MRAGFILRRLNELTAAIGNNPDELEKIRAEGRALDRHWRDLMRRLRRVPKSGRMNARP
jgi:hypothetical protein